MSSPSISGSTQKKALIGSGSDPLVDRRGAAYTNISEISSVRRHLAEYDGDDDNEDDEVPEMVHINKELFERKHMERAVRPHKNASAPILAAIRNRTRGRPERPHARMADRTDGRDAARQADCLQRAACVYGAARRRDELHAGNTAVNSKVLCGFGSSCFSLRIRIELIKNT